MLKLYFMIRHLAFGFFALTLVIASCKKGKAEFTLTGTLSDATHGTSLGSVSVSLYEVEAGTLIETKIGSMQTSSDGAYSFTFPRNQVESYILRASKDNFFPIEESILFSDLTIEEDNVRNYSTTAKGWMKLVFTNTAPANTGDILRFTKQVGKSDCDECLTDGEHQLYGIVDTVIYCATDANTTFTYYYEVAGTAVSGFKSGVAPESDTAAIILNY